MTNANEEEPKVLIDWKKVFINRSEFLKLVGFSCAGLIGLAMAIPGVAFVVGYFFQKEPPEWISVGELEKFAAGETVNIEFEDPYALPWDGVTGRRGAWVRRNSDDTFLAFAVNCTHLGCPVRWEKGAELFFCPCHGGVFYSNGDVAAGPPPRPLHQYDVRIQQGQVEIRVRPVLNEA